MAVVEQATDLGRTLMADIGPFFEKYLNLGVQVVQRKFPDMFQGLSIAWQGGWQMLGETIRSGEYKSFILGYGKWLLVFYGIFAALGFTILSPLFAVLLVLAPGMIVQALMTIPHFAFDFTCHDNPQLFSNVFLNQFRRVNPSQSTTIKEGLKKNPYRLSILGRVEDRALRWFHFLRTSTVYGVIGFIPIIGPMISTVGQWFKSSEELCFTLLEPWFRSMGWTTAERTHFVDAHKWLLIGFGMPFALLNSLPVINVFTIGVAEGATALLVERALQPLVGKEGKVDTTITERKPVDNLKSSRDTPDIVQSVKEQVPAAIESAKEQVPAAIEYAKEQIPAAIESVKQQAPAFIESVREGVEQVAQDVQPTKEVKEQDDSTRPRGGSVLETMQTSKPMQKDDVFTGGKGQVAETSKLNETDNTMGTQRQSMAGPTMMEKDLSEDLRKAAGIPRLAPRSDIVHTLS